MPLDSQNGRERLLDLFPFEAVKELPQVEKQMTKAEAVSAIAAAATEDALLEFVATHFGRLHQNVYVFEPVDGLDPATLFGPQPFTSEENGGETHHFYLLTLAYDLVLADPLERRSLVFSWPAKLVEADHVRVHFAMMAKSPRAYVSGDRPVLRSAPEQKDDDFLGAVSSGGSIDLNKGIKALWAADVFDAPTVRYKQPKRTSRDVMDEDFTVKSDAEDLYKDIADKPLFETTFSFIGDAPCIDYFRVDPTHGSMAFRIHSNTNECVDSVIRRILEAN